MFKDDTERKEIYCFTLGYLAQIRQAGMGQAAQMMKQNRAYYFRERYIQVMATFEVQKCSSVLPSKEKGE